MSNLTRLPIIDGFETTLSQAWSGWLGTVFLNDTPNITLGSDTTCIVVDPGKTTMQVAEVDTINTTLDTVNVSSITIKKWAGLNYTQQPHSSGAVVIISDNYQFRLDIQTAINSKLGNDGSNPTSTYDLDLTTTAWRHRNDAGAMKFTDNFQSEVTLSQLAAGAGVNDKTKVSITDTTAWYLDTKLTVTAPVVKAITSPSGDERLNLSHDFTNTTYYKTSSAWAWDSGKVPKLDGTGKLDTTFLPTYPTLRKNVTTFTYDTSTATGSQVVNHWLWVTPTYIAIAGVEGNNTTQGAWDGTNNKCIYKNDAGTITGIDTTHCIRSSATANNSIATVSAADSTTFTLSWTKQSSPTGTMSFLAELITVV